MAATCLSNPVQIAKAQDIAEAPEPQIDIGSDTIFLGEIIVQARKISEPLQEAPLAVTVFDEQEIERARIDDARRLSLDTPGLNFVDTGVRGSNISNIRGVGSFFPQSADDTSVPLFLDGIPIPVRAQDLDYFDIAAIEVLRGPQSALYGRNAQAGAINIRTVDPTYDPFAQIGGEIGNQDYGRVTALVNGPLGDTVAGRFGIQFDTLGGHVPDLNLGTSLGGHDIVNSNSKILWQPGEATDVTFALRYGNYDEDPVGAAWRENPSFPQTFLDMATSYKLETIGGGLTIEHDFDFATLTSVTGFNHYNSLFMADDSDGLIFQAITGLPAFFFNNPSADYRRIEDHDNQLSQEVRLDGELDNGTRWLAGVNLFRSDLDLDFTSNSTGFIFGRFNNGFTNESYALFGEATIPFNERLRLTGGARYTHERRKFSGQFIDLSGGTLGFDSSEASSLDFNLWTGRAALSYDLTADVTGYLSAARGAKAGGFQLADFDAARGLPTSTFQPAFTWTYETGLRGTVLNGILDVSTSAFFNDTTDEHVQVFEPITFQSVIENVDTETYGVEFETALRPVAGLTLSGGLALLHTEITKSADPSVRVGNAVPFAPSVTVNLAVEYAQPVVVWNWSGEAYLRAEYQYVGTRTVDPQNTFDLDPFDVVNLYAGWNNEAFSVYGFVTNLFDEDYAQTAFVFGAAPTGGLVSVGVPGEPRRFGMGLKYTF